VEPALRSLADKHLLHIVPDAAAAPGAAGPRFAMLEVVREYAEERLAASGDLAATRCRHASYFVALAEEAYAGALLHLLAAAI